MIALLAVLLQSPASVTVPQLSEPQRPGAASVGASSPSLASTGGKARGDLASAPEQLGAAGPTADASPALSSLRQGRTLAAAAVEGRDRCDASSGQSDSRLCRERVETRAGEFATPGAAPVTAEGRLLLLTQPQGGVVMTAAGASRQLGGTAADVERAAGAAAGELAAVISRTQAGAPPTASTADPTGGALPSGVPSVVVTGPR